MKSLAIGYIAVNLDRKETLTSTEHIDTGYTFWELSGKVLFGNLLTYYMLTRIGDRISFINDRQDELNLFGERYIWNDFADFRNVTEEVVDELIKAGLYRDEGTEWIDQDESLYLRKLVNVFDPTGGQSTGMTELPPVPIE